MAVKVTGVPNISELGGAGDIGNLTQQLSDSWVVAQFPGIDAIPGVQALQDAFSGLAQFLVQVLEVVNQILQAAKTFVVAYSNPAQTLAKVLIEQVQLLIKDIRQIGLYLTHDYDLVKEGWPLKSLRGGYAAYEQRMVARLTDQTDPTRPEVSDQTYVLGVFFYLSVDISNVYTLVKSLQQMLTVFGVTFGAPSQGLPAVSTPKVQYGYSQNNLVSSVTTAFKSSGNPLTIASLEWSLTPPAGSDPSVTVPLPAPQGFIIEVAIAGSEELQLWASRPSASQGGATTNGAGDSAEPRETMAVLDGDGNPIILQGGADLLLAKQGTSISTALVPTGDGFVPNARFYYLAKAGDKANPTLIPPEKLKNSDGSVYYLQRTFKMSQAEIFMDPAVGLYRYSVALADLPHKASFTKMGDTIVVKDLGVAKNYTVRISAISDDADKYSPADPQFALKYDLTVPPAPQGDVVINLINSVKPSVQRGSASNPAYLSFAAKTAGDFFRSLQSALALLVLLRSDLSVLTAASTPKETLDKLKAHTLPVNGDFAQSVLAFSDGSGTDLELFADTLFAQLVPTDKAGYFRGSGNTPEAWCSSLSGRLKLLAEDIYQRMGSLPAIETYLAQNTKELRELSLFDICEGKFSTGSSIKIGAFRMLDATVLGTLNKTDKYGEPILGTSPSGLASSPFQAFDLFNMGSLSLALNEGPYLWYKPPTYTLLKACSVAELEGSFASTPEEAQKNMARMGWRKGTRAEFGVGASTEEEYLKLQSFPARDKILFQSEGYPALYQLNEEGFDAVTYVPVRALFDTPTGRKVMQQAQLVLNVAAATLNTQQGQWLALRFGNTVFNGNLNELLTKFNNYVKAINNAFAATTQVVTNYINFLQARIRELQRFIGLINYYIQQLDQFVIPQMAVLTVVAPGTAGVLSAFTAANNKPADGPASYGAGAAAVVPLLAGTKFIVDIITAAQADQAGA